MKNEYDTITIRNAKRIRESAFAKVMSHVGAIDANVIPEKNDEYRKIAAEWASIYLALKAGGM